MTDSGGNTHRAELCVDKLWNFDSPTGLQGLIELRAFATVPEVEQQSLAALFVRAILAMLATKPCAGPLVRWEAALHDAYMLPTLLLQDLRAICADLATVGLEFDPSWLQPLLEQRFPVLGRLGLDGGEVLVRQALEGRQGDRHFEADATDEKDGPGGLFLDDGAAQVVVQRALPV